MLIAVMRIHINSVPCFRPTPPILKPLSDFPTRTIMAHCKRCNRWFLRDYSLEQHKDASRSHWPCRSCDGHLDFESHDALKQHYIRSQNHSYCEECDRLFKSEAERRQHMDEGHWYCRKHDQVSTTLRASRSPRYLIKTYLAPHPVTGL